MASVWIRQQKMAVEITLFFQIQNCVDFQAEKWGSTCSELSSRQVSALSYQQSKGSTYKSHKIHLDS